MVNSVGRYEGGGSVMVPVVPMILVAGPTAPSSRRSVVAVRDVVATATARNLLARKSYIGSSSNVPLGQVRTAVEWTSNPRGSRIMLPATEGDCLSLASFQ